MAQPAHISLGQLGENIVAQWLVNRGYRIVERNYRKQWGELDIVAQKDGVLHFVEVKAGRWSGKHWPSEGKERYRPEDHMHTNKRTRLGRAVRTYLLEQRTADSADWTIDLAIVLVNETTHRAQVRWVRDVEV